MAWAKLDDATTVPETGERPEYSGWHNDGSKYEDVSYLVGWSSELMIKFGCGNTARPRYRAFVSKGAELLAVSYPKGRGRCSSPQIEGEVERWLYGAGWLPAFSKPSLAAPFIGMQGAGYTECYRAPSPGHYWWGVAVASFIVRRHDGIHDCGGC